MPGARAHPLGHGPGRSGWGREARVRLLRELGAEECRGLALPRWVTDQDVADGNAVAGLGPESGAGDDLERLLATAIPSAHPQAAPSRPRGVEPLPARGVA